MTVICRKNKVKFDSAYGVYLNAYDRILAAFVVSVCIILILIFGTLFAVVSMRNELYLRGEFT